MQSNSLINIASLKFKKNLKEVVFKLLDWLELSSEKNLEKTAIKKVLIFEGGGIGDLVMMFPAIHAIQKQFPRATLSFLVSPSAKDILSLHQKSRMFSEIMNYDLKRGHKGFFKKLKLIMLIRKKGYDLIYAPSRGQGMREAVLMVYLMGSPNRLGFKKGKIGLLHTLNIEFEEHTPILQQNLSLLRKAGVKVETSAITMNIAKKDVASAKSLVTADGMLYPRQLITVHVGSDWMEQYKCWPLKNYIELIRILADDNHTAIILVGNEKEAVTGKKILEKVKRKNVINAMGKTTISQTAAIIYLSDLFIGNESGPLHIASALKIPSVAIFGATSPDQILSSGQRCIAIRKDIPCSPCYTHDFALADCKNHFRCLTGISVSDVLKIVRKVCAKNAKTKSRHSPVSDTVWRQV
jgi:heptosyltransferase-2